MSSVKTNNLQLGQSVTATNNFTWYQPSTPDGTVRLGVGNSGATSSDVVSVSSAGLSSLALIPSGSSAPTNGMYLPTTNTVGWSTNSTERMRLDASGNLGLGVTPTTGWEAGTALQLGNNYSYTKYGIGRNYYYDGSSNRYITSAASGSYQISSGGAHVWSTASSGTAGNAISFTQAMTLDASGNLLVGTTNSSYSVGAGVKLINDGTNVYIAQVNTTSTNTTTTHTVYSTGASAYRFYVGMGGTVYATSTTISAISDQRLKENIVDLDVGLDAILSLKPRKFDWKAGKGKDIKEIGRAHV